MSERSEPLWTPSAERVAAANLSRFIGFVNDRRGLDLPQGSYGDLWSWSVRERESFWRDLWDFCGVIGDGPGEVTVVDGDAMPGARWFPEARLSYAENLLRRADSEVAIVFRAEDQQRRELTWRELSDAVSRLQQALADLGVGPGDRVAGFMANMPEAVIAMLAATSLGAVWSSCSPDFGHAGVLDRFGQIEPKVVFCPDAYWYGGKTFGVLDKVGAFVAELPSVERVVICPLAGAGAGAHGLERGVWLDDLVAPFEAAAPTFVRVPFDHPLYVMYSSGTTGVPKCIVHGVGGTLLQHLKEHQLHCDLRPGDRAFYFTTCGWMMWNWLVTALASECTLLLYDGSPFHPDGNVVFDFIEETRGALLGTSAKFIDAVAKAGLRPRESHDLSSVRLIASTGSPLAPESFDFVYEHIAPEAQLASICGGTDIISCFILGNPIGPVWRGEIQARGLGMAVEVFDDAGQPLRGDKGELVCTRPFPSMPVGFWGDPGDARYRAAYFERFEGIWCQGDFVELTERDGLVVYGRSDATLNPGGVRIGTAEIYRQVEQLPEILEALVIGQQWQGDTRVVLFVRLAAGVTLDEELSGRVRRVIRRGASPRHVPARVLAVPDIPRTKSGKIVELAVREVVHGRPVRNREALANPEALEHFRDRPELAE